MRDKVVVLFAVGVLLALVLVISCTEYKWDEWQAPESSSSVADVLSSSGTLQSSSSASASSSSGISSSSELKSYCVYSEMKMCFLGSYSSCPGDGELSSFCPYMSSSSSSNSSQNGQSSSSGAVREYDYCVFILNNMCLIGPKSECPQGSILSNSCPYNSSSSAESSSSSVVLSDISSSDQSSSDAALPSSSSVILSSSSETPIVSSSSSVDLPSSSSSVVSSSSTEAESSSSEDTPGSSSSVPMCGTVEYDPEKEFCYNSSSNIGEFCGSNPQKYYDPNLYECKQDINPNGIYLKTGITDSMDNDKHYDAVLIGTQTWMGENLNYETTGSKCYNDIPVNCDKYGRLYNWNTAMANSASTAAIPSGVRGVCPDGWHLPSDAEWEKLRSFVGDNAGTKLKATSSWGDSGNGTDIYGFAALMGGQSTGSTNGFVNTGGYWWSTTESSNTYNYAYHWFMYANEEAVRNNTGQKTFLHSVRCVQD